MAHRRRARQVCWGEMPLLWRTLRALFTPAVAHERYFTFCMPKLQQASPLPVRPLSMRVNGPPHKECQSVQAGAGRAAGCNGHC